MEAKPFLDSANQDDALPILTSFVLYDCCFPRETTFLAPYWFQNATTPNGKSFKPDTYNKLSIRETYNLVHARTYYYKVEAGDSLVSQGLFNTEGQMRSRSPVSAHSRHRECALVIYCIQYIYALCQFIPHCLWYIGIIFVILQGIFIKAT